MASFAFIAALLLACAAVAQAQTSGGASSVNSLMQAIIGKYGRGVPAYNSVGSSLGIAGFISGKYQIGLSDDAMTAAQDHQAPPKYTLPLAFSAYSFFVSGSNGVALTGTEAANIYLGNIKTWSQIPAGRRGKQRGTIVPVARADGSGTTELFTKFFQRTKSRYPGRLVGQGPFSFPNRNTQYAAKTGGVVVLTKGNTDAICYAQTGAGIAAGLFEVAIANAAHAFVLATRAPAEQSIPRALPPPANSWAGVSLLLQPGASTYPIASFAYMFARQKYGSAAAAGAVRNFLLYTQSAGIQSSAYMGPRFFTNLPAKISRVNVGAIKRIY